MPDSNPRPLPQKSDALPMSHHIHIITLIIQIYTHSPHFDIGFYRHTYVQYSILTLWRGMLRGSIENILPDFFSLLRGMFVNSSSAWLLRKRLQRFPPYSFPLPTCQLPPSYSTWGPILWLSIEASGLVKTWSLTNRGRLVNLACVETLTTVDNTVLEFHQETPGFRRKLSV